MNLELTGEEFAFREEMRKFFTTEFSPELRARAAGFGKLTREDIVAGQQILNAHGLAVPHWPVEWGGKDWTPVQRHIYSEEMQLASVPNPLPFNVSMVGPVIAAFGSQEQKEKFLPATLTPISGGAKVFRNQKPVRISLHSRRLLSVTARITSSTVRRRGLLSRSTPSGSSVWFGQMPVPRSVRQEFRSCSSIWRLPASRFVPSN
ncbi:hypothetical protein N806_05790 [Rhodococcus sp. P27]|nr:hypothetical protein N806_05790 [Rhodococcus sp. P27]